MPDNVMDAIFDGKTDAPAFTARYQILGKGRFIIYRRGQKNGVEIARIPEDLNGLVKFFDDLGALQQIIGDMSAAV